MYIQILVGKWIQSPLGNEKIEQRLTHQWNCAFSFFPFHVASDFLFFILHLKSCVACSLQFSAYTSEAVSETLHRGFL